MKIRSKTISYAAMRKRANEERENELENNRQALVTLTAKKLEGVLLRSRARSIAEGEKIRFFFLWTRVTQLCQ